MSLDWSAKGRARIYAFTALGTVVCIAVAFVVDSYSFTTGTWRWGSDPINNLLIPLLLAPPFFFILLSKQRELAIAHHELMTVAATDSLTCLLNRRAFTEMVDGYLQRIEEAPISSEGALLIIDVDHFKKVNDRFGHDRGDEALKLIAATVKANVRDTDLVGRVGGEEFCVFIPRHPAQSIPLVAERIRTAVYDAEFVVDGERYRLSISVGGAIFGQYTTFSDLYRSADAQLYDAKRNGRNRVELCTLAMGMPAHLTLH
jgi:diguanylate cyclase (GGDEF)-like protein